MKTGYIKKVLSSISSKAGVFMLLVFTLSSVSCGSKKVLAPGEARSDLSAKQIIKNHYRNDIDFNTLRGKIRVDYKDAYTDQGFSVSLRMKKDEAIWLSATMSVVKVLITPDRVSFYNKLDNTYFDGDFSYLNKLLGTDLNFQMVQNLLLGQSVMDLNEQRYTASVSGELYQLKPDRSNELYKLLFLLEPNHFKMAGQQLSEPHNGRMLNIAYESYQDVGGKVIPDKMVLRATDGVAQTKIELEYRNVEFNQNISFPYRIPDGYKALELD